MADANGCSSISVGAFISAPPTIRAKTSDTVVRRRRAHSDGQRGAQAETSQRNLLMIGTLDHVESTIRPKRVLALPQVMITVREIQLRV